MIYCCVSRRLGAAANVWRLFYDFVFISSLTSCRHNRNPTRVTEALQHGITHQRYQHDFDTEIFALINQKKKFSRGKIKGGVVQEREISTTKKTQGKFVSQFPGFLFQLSDSWKDVNATETRTELREKFIREAFFSGLFSVSLRAAFVVTVSEWIMRNGSVFFFILNDAQR